MAFCQFRSSTTVTWKSNAICRKKLKVNPRILRADTKPNLIKNKVHFYCRNCLPVSKKYHETFLQFLSHKIELTKNILATQSLPQPVNVGKKRRTLHQMRPRCPPRQNARRKRSKLQRHLFSSLHDMLLGYINRIYAAVKICFGWQRAAF